MSRAGMTNPSSQIPAATVLGEPRRAERERQSAEPHVSSSLHRPSELFVDPRRLRPANSHGVDRP
jgi:hypothetical protein